MRKKKKIIVLYYKTFHIKQALGRTIYTQNPILSCQTSEDEII